MPSLVGPQDDLMMSKTASNIPFMGGRKPLDIVIVGGSHTALFASILLKRQGHNTHILESAPTSTRSGMAAGVGLAAYVKQFFDENDKLKDIPFGTPHDFMHVRNPDMSVKAKFPMYLRMTTWDATYYRLRANYDGLVSEYCSEPPDLSAVEGRGVYETGVRVVRVDDEKNAEGKLKVLAESVETGEQKRYEADVVIAADGSNSTIRRQLYPELKREEPGYVLWRGTVPTADLSKELLDEIEGNTTLYPMPYSYCIIYTIPGHAGSLASGDCHINIGWYTYPSRSHLTTPSILTDTSGHTHHTTLPKGSMRPKIWSQQLAHAKRTFPPLLYTLISKIETPFVGVVSTSSCPRASHMNNRLFLIGDALAQVQPNTAQGTNLAAMGAMTLAKVFAGEMGAEEWEERMLGTIEREKARAVAFASGWLCGWFGWGWANARWRWVLVWQGVWGWWSGRARL